MYLKILCVSAIIIAIIAFIDLIKNNDIEW